MSQPNHTDLLLSDNRALLSRIQKVELDDAPSLPQRWSRDLAQLLGFRANPIHITLDSLAWFNGSASLLILARIWNPLVIPWLIGAVVLCGLTMHSATPSTIRLLAVIRLILLVMGAVALI